MAGPSEGRQASSAPLASRDVPLLLRAIKLVQEALGRAGLESGRMDTRDRRLLEQVILPAISGREDVNRVLFVGCARYTRDYWRLFPGKEYWTLDIAPARARWGSERHVVGSVTELGRHFEAGYLDAVVLNGVIGWGLNGREEVERALVACHQVLREGGILLVGWDEALLTHIDLRALIGSTGLFEPYVFEPLKASEVRVEGMLRHVYDFLQRPRSAGPVGGHGDAGAGGVEGRAPAPEGAGQRGGTVEAEAEEGAPTHGRPRT
jgi:hypothetical protein